jgi:5-methylthioribose kinase
LINLIIGSCFTRISRIRSIQNHKDKESNFQNLLEGCVSKSIASLYKNVQAVWKQQSDLLTKIESETMNVIFDKFLSFTKKDKKDMKDKFLGGIENIDFDAK